MKLIISKIELVFMSLIQEIIQKNNSWNIKLQLLQTNKITLFEYIKYLSHFYQYKKLYIYHYLYTINIQVIHIIYCTST